MLNDKELMLAVEVIRRFQESNPYFYSTVVDEIESFLKSDLDESKKVHVLEQLYLLELYKRAYTSPSPDGRSKFLYDALRILKATNDAEYEKELQFFEASVGTMKELETDPLKQIQKKIDHQSSIPAGTRF